MCGKHLHNSPYCDINCKRLNEIRTIKNNVLIFCGEVFGTTLKKVELENIISN